MERCLLTLMNANIYVTKSIMPSLEEYTAMIAPMWNNHMITNMGPLHTRLEQELKTFLHLDHILLMTNGHISLELALQALDLPEHSEIITTPFTFISTTHAIVRNGLVPVFCDINPQDFTIDTDKLEKLITEKTSAILPVHVYGNICHIEAIEAIAARHHLKILYDAAHTFGETYKGIPVGNLGDVSIFSFHATKVFNTIEGGAVCFHDEDYGRRLQDLRNFGIRDEEEIPGIGSNAKMDEFRAAMGLCNLKYIPEAISQRKHIAERYFERLAGVQGIRLNVVSADTESNYAYFPIVFDGYRKSRNQVYTELKSYGIYSRKYFYPITPYAQCYRNTYGSADVTTAAYISERILTVPIYPDLSSEDVDRICDIIIQN